jgi:formate-nitrite transporter family protein
MARRRGTHREERVSYRGRAPGEGERGHGRSALSERDYDASSPLKPHRVIFEQETHEAVGELRRPTAGLLASGFVAGFGVGLGVLAAVIVLAHFDGVRDGLFARFLLANALAIGFIVVIMAHTDLYTEYTTIAIFPVLTGQATIAALARLWVLIYLSNLAGSALFAGLLVAVGPQLGFLDLPAATELAERFAAHGWWVILLSSLLAGWLMGLLSWLITASRETISQICVIWLITGTIAFAHLHHAVSVSLEGFLALFATGGRGLGPFAYTLAWTTLGNAIGGILFAVMIRYSALMGEEQS